MNRIVGILAIVLVAALSGCSNQEQPQIKTPDNQALWVQEKAHYAPSADMEAHFFSDPYPIRDAAILLSDFFMQPALYNLGRHKSIGGAFDATYFKMKPGKTAVRLWYCYNPNDPQWPEFFLALEQIEKYDSTTVEKNISAELVVPEVFIYSESTTDAQTTEAFIRNRKTMALKNQKIDSTTVLKYATNFKSLMSIISLDPREPYCKYAVSIFDANPSYNDFMAQNQAQVHYFLGFALSPKNHKPNYLRPLLAAVDSSGSLIMRSSAKGTDESLLQKSVPPPPHQ